MTGTSFCVTEPMLLAELLVYAVLDKIDRQQIKKPFSLIDTVKQTGYY